MSVDISREDFNTLETHLGQGKTAQTVNQLRENGIDDAAITDRLNTLVARQRDQEVAAESKIKSLAQQNAEAAAYADERRARELRDNERIEKALALVGGWGDSASGGIGSGVTALISPTLASDFANVEKKHPGYATTGEVMGLFTPSGIPARAINYGAKLGKIAKGAIVGEKATRAAQAAGYLTEIGIRSAAMEGQYQIQKNIRRAAGTEDWKEGQTILGVAGDFGTGTLANMGFDMILGGAGAAFRKIKDNIRTTDTAIELMGGKANVLAGRRAFEDARNRGLSDVEAAGAYFAKIAEGVTPEQSENIAKMIQKSPTFRAQVMQQMAAGEQIVYKTANALTNKEKGKLAENIDNYLGQAYLDAVGARQLGTTADDLVHYMGVNSKNFQEIKSAGLEEAQARVNSHYDEFEEGTKIAGLQLRQDYEATNAIRESANVADFSALQPGGYAEKSMQRFVDEQKRKYISSRIETLGEGISPEETQEAIAQFSHTFDDQMADGVRKRYAQTFCDNIIKNGSANVYDLMDMQNHVKNVMKKDVMKGASTAPGVYHKELNRMLGAESKILDGSLKAMQNSDEMLRLHKMGETFDGSQIADLRRTIDSVEDAKEAATKLSGFKLGFENQLLDAMIVGDSQRFAKLKAMTDKSGVLGEFFEAGELQRFAQASAPKVVAANNLKTWLKATGKYEGNATLIDAVIRTFIAGAAGARVAGANAAVTTARKIGFGPRTMATVEEFATNPSAESFNKMLGSAKDTTERNLMLRVIDSLGDATNQYIIRAGKTLTQE